ncbi:MFS transporter [Kitasatospora sp. NPDC085895]|uniref:MFS transporter n=1 Tax=Kitasatospora sp. NPDC085895 TaxID=3155057 RepID=UPI00344D2D4C
MDLVNRVRRSPAALLGTGPSRLLVSASLAGSIGLGMYGSGSLLFFTRVQHLSIAQVGSGLSIAAVVALLVGIPAGRAADVVGARRMVVGAGLLQAVLLCAALTTGSSYPLYLVVMCLLGAAKQAEQVARGAVVATVCTADERVEVQARMRSVFNIGVTVGILLAGAATAWDTRAAYAGLMVANAVTAVCAAGIIMRLPATAGRPRGAASGDRWEALRDYPYLAVAVLCGFVAIADAALTVGLPLWVVDYTSAPRPVGVWLLAVNTVLISLFQVWASRGAKTAEGARRLLRRSCAATAAACFVFVFAAWVPAVPAVLALVVAVGVLTLGELWGSAAAWFLRYSLAKEGAQGEYGGVFGLATGIPAMLGPGMVTFMMTEWRGWSWVAVGVLGLLAAAVSPSVLRRAETAKAVRERVPVDVAAVPAAAG